jgi:hypothetical protein
VDGRDKPGHDADSENKKVTEETPGRVFKNPIATARISMARPSSRKKSKPAPKRKAPAKSAESGQWVYTFGGG